MDRKSVGPLDKGHVPPGGSAQMAGIVVAHRRPLESVIRQLVPLLAGHFTGLAPDAQRGVGEKSLLTHRYLRGFWVGARKGFCTFGRSRGTSAWGWGSRSSRPSVSIRRAEERRPPRILPVTGFDFSIQKLGDALKSSSALD